MSAREGSAMKLATEVTPAGEHPAAVVEAGVLGLAAGPALSLTPDNWRPASVRALLDAGPEALAIARRLVEAVAAAPESTRERLQTEGYLQPLAEARLRAPVPDPRL